MYVEKIADMIQDGEVWHQSYKQNVYRRVFILVKLPFSPISKKQRFVDHHKDLFKLKAYLSWSS